ncbi:hypothetical protein EM61_020155 [Vibrio parahaemolyticus]|uniref:hypothetical protein n=1 Tax=Vibrio parahaemolyticus TaxID=670 RepID=UPI0004087261|nr:hypothetical protein [Vibrio parahaemolyticus]ELN6894070.1 hypothetical protein [Vibrio cholerae]EIK4811116.1 hypothetical protein [Vibrio parahaemolyticus]EKC5524133.1 hypothetical protein [Vibrio parahaemolyticus]KKC79462.1 hypothetical protein WR32_00190 [Vibrio parahaemolyticus]KKX76950.1 hypothetical protein UF35_08405 [Vibrio parahaemolyticus]
MKKYFLIPVLMLSFNAFAEVTKEEVSAMRQEVKGMTKEEVTAKHIELFEAVKADPSEKNCHAFEVFDLGARKEKKITIIDPQVNKRVFEAKRPCLGYNW